MDPELTVIDEEFVPTPNVDLIDNDDPNMFDVVDDSNEPTAEDLRAQLEATKKEMELLKQSSDLSTGMQQGFQTLAQQLQAQKAPDYSNLPGLPNLPQNQNTQNFSLPDKETFEKEFFVNPYESLQKFLAPVISSQQATVSTQMAEMNKMVSKNNAYMNESNKDILSKYGDEVQVYASRLSGNDPWGDAIKQVRTNHFNDIMQETVKSAEQRAYEKAKADLEAAKANLTNNPGSPVGTSNLGGITNPQPSKIKVTKAQMDKVKQMTAAKFGPNSGAEVEMQMYEYMKNNGML